jgi:uncharacterized protein (DUF1697 family)
MADLRAVIADLGHANVLTLLNSGNVVFDSTRKLNASSAAAIREAIAAKTGVTAEVIVVPAADLVAIVAEDPFAAIVNDPSRYLVAFTPPSVDLAKASALMKEDWVPDRFAIGSRAAYLWCAGGILESKLLEQFSRLMGETVTTRNWATVLKLHTMIRQSKHN